jgi:hypothetical protein
LVRRPVPHPGRHRHLRRHREHHRTRLITNTATIVVPGYESVTSTAALIANAYTVYLPLVLRNN